MEEVLLELLMNALAPFGDRVLVFKEIHMQYLRCTEVLKPSNLMSKNS